MYIFPLAAGRRSARNSSEKLAPPKLHTHSLRSNAQLRTLLPRVRCFRTCPQTIDRAPVLRLHPARTDYRIHKHTNDSRLLPNKQQAMEYTSRKVVKSSNHPRADRSHTTGRGPHDNDDDDDDDDDDVVVVTNKQTNERPNEQTNERPNEQTTNERTNE